MEYVLLIAKEENEVGQHCGDMIKEYEQKIANLTVFFLCYQYNRILDDYMRCAFQYGKIPAPALYPITHRYMLTFITCH